MERSASSPSRRGTLFFCLACAVILLCCATTVEAKRKTKQVESDNTDSSKDDIPGVNFLVEAIGKELYAAVNRPKYKFMIYMTFGRKLPDEHSTVAALNVVCNLLYSLCILVGFIFLPRGYMLIATLATLFVGPALVLILLGSFVLLLAAFAVYPVTSVFAMWCFFFLTSQMAQVLGRKLGLDHDGDGDVDMLDILSYAATTRLGKFVGLPKVHKMLNESSMDPFQEIYRRLDDIQDSTRALGNGAKED